MSPTLEEFLMALRYLYYVKGEPALTDMDYDLLEGMARMIRKR